MPRFSVMPGGWGWGFVLTTAMMDSVKPQWGQRLTGLKHLIAPLLGLSLGLHGLLLLTPLPTSDPEPAAQEPEPSEEESTVDLLSISRLATASPIPNSPPPTAASPAAPPPMAALPQAPAPYPTDIPPAPLNPETESVAIEEPLVDSATPTEAEIPVPDPATEPPATTPGFDPNRQFQVLDSASGGLGRAPGSSNFDLTDQFPGDIWDLYISRWAEAKKQCFFNTIDRDSYALRAPAADLRYLSRNIQLVEQQDIPRTFAEQTVQPLGSAYCEAHLFEVQDQGTPILWVSLVPVSPGGSTTLVIFWAADPRG